jgi:outer membrane receptor for ferrienterochelin and colicins
MNCSIRRPAAVVFLLWIAAALPAHAQSAPDMAEISLEELMQFHVQQIFGASDRLQPVTEVPSSVSIVTADEISRYGYRTLADILQGVRGFYVTNDRNYSYVGARGFNRPGDYSTRVLLLVNGRRVNDNVYDQASVGAEFGIDAAMFERVEIIRGPASSLYGANALFAVVNVITRTGASLNGAALKVDAGTLGTDSIRASAGRTLANGMDVVLSGTYEQSGGVAHLRIPTFDLAHSNGGVADDLDGERDSQVYGQVTLHNLTVSGTAGRRAKDVPTASFSTMFNAHDPMEQTLDRRESVSAEYARVISGARVTTEAALDHSTYGGVYPYAGDGSERGAIVYRDGSRGWRWTVGSHASRSLPGRQTLALGGELVDNVKQDQWGRYPFDSTDNFAIDHSSRQGAAYVQDEVKLRAWLLLNGGLRHDRYPGFSRTTPRGAVIVMPSPNQSLKYVYGRAFRPPNAYERYYYRNTSPALMPESIHTHEWVWEGYFGEHVRTAVSTYRYEASQLIALQLVKPDEVFNRLGFVNGGIIRARGLEFESEVRLKRGASALGSYAIQNGRDASLGDSTITNSPRHLAKLRMSVPGPVPGSSVSLDWQYVSRRATIAGASVDPASLANMNLSVPLGHAAAFTGQVRNLFNTRYSDPASEEHLGDAIEQNGRTMRVGVQWSFWRSK